MPQLWPQPEMDICATLWFQPQTDMDLCAWDGYGTQPDMNFCAWGRCQLDMDLCAKTPLGPQPAKDLCTMPFMLWQWTAPFFYKFCSVSIHQILTLPISISGKLHYTNWLFAGILNYTMFGFCYFILRHGFNLPFVWKVCISCKNDDVEKIFSLLVEKDWWLDLFWKY